MTLRLACAVAAGKLTCRLSRALGLGGGTTLPGRVARTVAPSVLRDLAGRLRRGCVLISGTNGKTTTARLLAEILREAGWVPIHNRAGANLPAGVTSALVEAADARGHLRGEIGVFEVDEAALAGLVEVLRPRLVVLLNLFRDQLDRYGEVEAVARRWRAALVGTDASVCFNADDPQVADVVRGRSSSLPFGVEDDGCRKDVLEDAADVRYCYRCGTPYAYTAIYLSHLGQYACGRCGIGRPKPVVYARSIALEGTHGLAMEIVHPKGHLRIRTALPGLYNAYNVLAAAAAALTLRIAPNAIERAVEHFRPAFGRAERLRWQGRELVVLLGKNPAGFNELLRTVVREAPQAILIAINDRIADGRDVSWLWDVDFEGLSDLDVPLVTSGLRALDCALRLKYAGVPEDRIVVEPDLGQALQAAIQAAPENGTVVALPTYTAMLDLRRILERLRAVCGFWED
jgi:UDP-N-acetylmuramyl tripeptide synthase